MSNETTELLGKLGLGAVAGAAITAIFTFFTSWLSRRHEIRRERFKRKQEVLEKIAADFEGVHAAIMELYSNFGTFIELEEKQPGSAEFSKEKAVKIIIERIFPALTTVHSIEGRLMLLGYDDAAKMFRQYRNAATDLQNQAHTDPASRLPLKEWDALFLKSHEMRKSIYENLQLLYKVA